jgi:hypothetical protein
MPGIGTHAEHAADMVEDDRGVGKGAGKIDRVRQLRMILPGPAIRSKFFLSVKPLTLLDQFLNDAA